MHESGVIVEHHVSTTDADEAASAMSAVFGQAHLVRAEVPWKFAYEHHAWIGPRLTYFHVRCVGAGRASTSRTLGLGDSVAVSLVHSGTMTVQDENGAWRDVTGAVLFHPTSELRVFEADLDATVVSFRVDALLERASRRVPGIVALNFDASPEPDPASVVLWRAIITHVERLQSQGLDDGRVQDNVFAALADLALDMFGLARDGAEPRSLEQPPLVRSAIAYVDTHLDRAPHVAEVATAVGVDEHRLRQAFTAALGVSPARYIREQRLAAARVELVAAEPHLTTVAKVSARWGFANPSNFTKLYRERYGESPAETLRR